MQSRLTGSNARESEPRNVFGLSMPARSMT
jgi:hypothetical protein